MREWPAMVTPPADARVRLRITTVSGRVTVRAESGGEVVVGASGSVSENPDGDVEIRPRKPSDSVEVTCPSGADVIICTRSGNVELAGVLGSVGITTVSGRIDVASVSEADLRTVSGSVQLGECLGQCRVSTKSGRITVRATRDAEIATVSGRVSIEDVTGSVDVRAVSGRVSIGSAAQGPVRVSMVSGGVTIRLPRGVRPSVQAKGLGVVQTVFEPGDDVAISVATVSGRVRLVTD
jgi:DUF4097 and DUF4098 domain-containing protein YvlB